MRYLQMIGFSFAASVCIAYVFRAPRRSVLPAALIAAAGYLLFAVICEYTDSHIVAYFTGTLIISLLSELMARLLKMPATVFMTTAIIPLVPGADLYNAMRLLLEGRYAQAGETGAAVMLSIGAMAMAVAINTLVIKFAGYLRRNRVA